MNTDSGMEIEVALGRRTKKGEGQCGPILPQIPRISRLLALAIKSQDMIDRGEARDYADLARLGYVSRARVTQIMNLLLLAPDIQDEIIEMNLQTDGNIAERHVRSVVRIAFWEPQRLAWSRILRMPT